MLRSLGIFVGAAAVIGFGAAVGPAAAQQGVKTGTLVCNVSAGMGFIIGSNKAIRCRFTGANGQVEDYDGHVTKFGLDIGATTGGTIIWAVFEPTAQHGSLGGTYAGVTAQATIGAGLGANVLVGGSSSSVALQPLSVEGQTGLNVAAGVGGLELVKAP